MCGIVGYISTKDDLYPGAKRHFSDFALMLDTLRGMDSTGLIRVNNEFDVHTAHTTMAGTEYVNHEAYKSFMDEFDGWAFVGHNRAATAGSVKLDNAHPFTFGDVTMVHNGTLWNKGQTMPGYDPKLEVDSMQVARCLSEVGSDSKEVAELLSKIDGSFALVWVDRRDESINMCRNSARPIHFGFNKDKDIMWFMSDGTHLRAITASMYKSQAKIDTIYSMDKMKILKFKKGSLVPEVTTFAPFVPKQQVYTTKKYDTGTALATAAKRWQDSARKAATAFLTGGTEGKALVAGQRRSIPANHTSILTEWYELGEDTLVEFEAEEWIEVDNKKCVVTGKFFHPDWGYGEWPCTLYNVPLVICTAYGDQRWAVKAKGVGSCHTMYKAADVVALIAELYSYNASDVMDTQRVKEYEKEDNYDTGMVVGPDEMLMERGKCMKLLAKGCIQCGGSIDWEEKKDAQLVNEDRDLLCPACALDWGKEAIPQ